MANYVVVDTRLMLYNRFHRNQSLLPVTSDIANISTSLGGLKKKPAKVIFAFDKGKSRRTEVFKEYKAHRKDAIKKKGADYKEKLDKFNEDYDKFEEYLLYFGHVASIQGVEADDIASILSASSMPKNGNTLFLVSSDSDWVKFLRDDRDVRILNPAKNKVITYDNCASIYGYTPEQKLFMDSLTGVGKENVPGIYRFGPKTFLKMWNEYDGNVDDIIEVLGKMFDNTDKLPDRFTSVRAMYEFNLELFRPWTITDLTKDEAELLKKQITEYKGPSTVSTILEASYDTFGKLHMPSYKEQSFYGISDDS